jgi:hypothetical protein
MNKALFANKMRYPEIVLWWESASGQTELRLHNLTLKEAYEKAIVFGYKPPVWFKPWQYITGGIGVMTIGFGKQDETV